jgi:hypothetical protein
MHIETQHADDVDFSTYKTWNWLPEPAKTEIDTRLSDPLVVARIRRAIETELRMLGFKKVPASPDFIVTYHAALEDHLSESAVDNAYDTAMYQRYDQNWTYQYTSAWVQGTLLIDILDAQAGELVWRGSAQAEITMNASDDEKDKRVDEAVHKILKAFPPK